MTLQPITTGKMLYIAAAVVLFVGGIGSPIIPNPALWGLFCIVLGTLFGKTPAR